MSDDTCNVTFSAFVRAQRKFGPALKSSTNPHFKSRYADLAACVEAVIDALHSEGFALTQYTEPDEHGIKVKTVLLHESGDLLTLGELYMPAVKNDPQGFGSALTYCRRYSLLAAMGLAPEDDDGNQATKKFKMPPHQLADWIAAIEGCTDAETLKVNYLQAYKSAEGDPDAQKAIIAAKDKIKAAL